VLINRFPLSKEDFNFAIKNSFSPDAVVYFNLDATLAVRRNHKTQLTNTEVTPENFAELKFIEEITSKIGQQIVRNSDMKSYSEAVGIPSIELNATRPYRAVLADALKELERWLGNRPNTYCDVSPIEEKEAQQLLDLGLKELSNLGRLCPVACSETPLRSVGDFGSIPVLHLENIYYLKPNNLQKFIDNTFKYLGQTAPDPILDSYCCVLGGPKSGRSTLAQALSKNLNAIHLTVPSILQAIIDGKENTSICEKILVALSNGNSVDDQTTVDAIVCVSKRVTAAGKGWILDGFPCSKEQAILLDQAGFQPHQFFNLSISESDIHLRAFVERTRQASFNTASNDALDLIQSKFNSWNQSEADIKAFFSNKYSNWLDLDGRSSKWALKDIAVTAMNTCLLKRQKYLHLKIHGRAAPIIGTSISNEIIAARTSKFLQYCPVALLDQQQLIKRAHEYAADYKEKYYFFSSSECFDKFLATPEKYINQQMPDVLPQRRHTSELPFPLQLELKGRCPVTFSEGPSIALGDRDLQVEYNSKIWAFKDGECLEKFMATPWKYCNAVLPVKLPPPLAPINSTILPTCGYLEQSIAEALHASMLSVGRLKPKYPFKTITDSAAYYIGLYLKANNPKSQDWIKEKYRNRLSKFVNTCDILKYSSDDDRIEELKTKMDSIFGSLA